MSGAPASPLVSSPGDSRTASPRARRRASRERSPPPLATTAGPPEQPILPHQLATNFENLSVADVSNA